MFFELPIRVSNCVDGSELDEEAPDAPGNDSLIRAGLMEILLKWRPFFLRSFALSESH